MRKKNIRLKVKLFEKDMRQSDLCKIAGVKECHLSMSINGKYNFTDDEMLRIASALECKVSDIFDIFDVFDV